MVYLHIFKTDGDKFFIKIPYKVKTAKMDGQHLLKMQSLGDNYIMIDLKRNPAGSGGCDHSAGSGKMKPFSA